MTCNRQVKVLFSIGTYKDEVICDVVPMEAGHLLLGRTWQYDSKINYNDLTNEITLTHLGTKLVLHPQTPLQVAKDQVEIKLKWDEEKNRKIKEEQTLIVKEECKEVSVSSKRLAKKESHFVIKTNIKETSTLRQPPHLLHCKEHLLELSYLLSLRLFLEYRSCWMRVWVIRA